LARTWNADAPPERRLVRGRTARAIEIVEDDRILPPVTKVLYEFEC